MVKSLIHLRDVTSFKAWLNQIVINTFYDYLRKLPQNTTTEEFSVVQIESLQNRKRVQ